MDFLNTFRNKLLTKLYYNYMLIGMEDGGDDYRYCFVYPNWYFSNYQTQIYFHVGDSLWQHYDLTTNCKIIKHTAASMSLKSIKENLSTIEKHEKIYLNKAFKSVDECVNYLITEGIFQI